MEFNQLNSEVISLECLNSKNDLSRTGLEILSELKELLKQRNEMLEKLTFIVSYGAKCDWNKLEADIKKLIEEATKID